MSKPKIVVSAVAMIGEDESIEQVWKGKVRPNLQNEDLEEYGGETKWHLSKGTWSPDDKSMNDAEYHIMISYHAEKRRARSKDEAHVVEIPLFDGEPKDLSLLDPGSIVSKANDVFENLDFRLEIYYWYTGTERPGVWR